MGRGNVARGLVPRLDRAGSHAPNVQTCPAASRPLSLPGGPSNPARHSPYLEIGPESRVCAVNASFNAVRYSLRLELCKNSAVCGQSQLWNEPGSAEALCGITASNMACSHSRPIVRLRDAEVTS